MTRRIETRGPQGFRLKTLTLHHTRFIRYVKLRKWLIYATSQVSNPDNDNIRSEISISTTVIYYLAIHRDDAIRCSGVVQVLAFLCVISAAESATTGEYNNNGRSGLQYWSRLRLIK